MPVIEIIKELKYLRNGPFSALTLVTNLNIHFRNAHEETTRKCCFQIQDKVISKYGKMDTIVYRKASSSTIFN